MENLAGDKNCDLQIEKELTRCGIEVVRDQPQEGEVPSSLRGKLGSFDFFRAWYYWAVSGSVPLEVAQELYTDPVGKTDIRVTGHCECPPPEEPWITWRTNDGHTVVKQSVKKQFEELIEARLLQKSTLDEYIFSDDPASIGASAYVESYHIDSEVGLRLFADTLKKHGLV